MREFDFLESMGKGSRRRVQAARAQCSEAALLEQALKTPLPPSLTLSPQGFDLIAELKLRSPALGQLRTTASTEELRARVTRYAAAGAACVSVLTEPSRFDGSLEHLAQAARALRPMNVPAMRKDFLVDPYQVMEARVAGAGGVLVIVRMLSSEQMHALIDCAQRLRLFVLLEAFDEHDIEVLHRLVGRFQHARFLAGINCRDLVTLQVVPGRLQQLAPLLPRSVPRVAESGIETAAAAQQAAAAGYSLALVGGALMKAADPHGAARDLIAAGRAGAKVRA